MALQEPSKFVGQITITTGTNDKLRFREYNGASDSDIVSTLTAGSYYPGDSSADAGTLAALIKTAMDTDSTYGATYTVTVSTTTGIFTITGTGGTMTGFEMAVLASSADNILTGAASTDQTVGANHVGWLANTSTTTNPSVTTDSADQAHCNGWWPSEPLEVDDEGEEFNSSSAVTLGGRPVTLDWSGAVAPNEISKLWTKSVGMQFLTDADRVQLRTNFLLPYGKTGAQFKFYQDRTDDAVETCVLWGDILQRWQPTRQHQQKWWRQALKMRRYVA